MIALNDFLTILGMFGGALMLLVGAAKYIISFFYKKQSDIEAIKEKYSNDQLLEFKSSLHQFYEELKVLRGEVTLAVERIKNNQKNYEMLYISIKEFVTATDLKITGLRSEIHSIGRELIIIKSKTKGK